MAQQFVEKDFAPEPVLQYGYQHTVAPLSTRTQGWTLRVAGIKKRRYIAMSPPETLPGVSRNSSEESKDFSEPGSIPHDYIVRIAEIGGWLQNTVRKPPSKIKKGTIRLLIEPLSNSPSKDLQKKTSKSLSPSHCSTEVVPGAVQLTLAPPFAEASMFINHPRSFSEIITLTKSSSCRLTYTWTSSTPSPYTYQWRKLGPSSTVLEFIQSTVHSTVQTRLALFVYTSDLAQQFDPLTGQRKNVPFDEIGELYVIRGDAHNSSYKSMSNGHDMAVETLLMGLLAVVESIRRC